MEERHVKNVMIPLKHATLSGGTEFDCNDDNMCPVDSDQMPGGFRSD